MASVSYLCFAMDCTLHLSQRRHMGQSRALKCALDRKTRLCRCHTQWLGTTAGSCGLRSGSWSSWSCATAQVGHGSCSRWKYKPVHVYTVHSFFKWFVSIIIINILTKVWEKVVVVCFDILETRHRLAGQ